MCAPEPEKLIHYLKIWMGSSYDFASFALYTTVVCQFMVALMYGFIVYETKIKKRQYSKEILSLFYYFKWFFLLIVVLIALSFVLIAIKFQSRFNDNTVYLSYQSLLLITTIIVCSINIALSRRLVVQVARTIRQNSTHTANPFNFDTTSVYSISKN
uniref:Transmembrane protein n=1 Tax=Caenorhabditis elegans TaxID=6239 RepID=G4RTI0_CAEEL|nr:Transmembrane protein [Caenorhabditis elegans]CCD68902.1 Transmembrane protein [Caenorhabditis elegans]|eukprot:NP_001254840.1 Uncharacterized protein CELE_Y34F4.5 [Caenorhabditis elegans]